MVTMRTLRRWNNLVFLCLFGTFFRHFAALVFVFAFITESISAAADSQEYVNLIGVAERFQLNPVWQEPQKTLLLRRDRAQIRFSNESREIAINEMRVFLGDPIRLHGNQLHISRTDFESTLRPLLAPNAYVSPGRLETIVIDPGHGGRDRGTSHDSLKLIEKNLTLEVSNRLARRLEEEGYRVRLTRTADQYVSLEDRVNFANRVGADLFISIHFNAVGNPDVRGTETYLLTPRFQRSTGQEKPAESDAIVNPGNKNDHWNTLLGYFLHRQLLRDLGTFDRGLKRARFAVLRTVESPAVLVEAGYLSNSEEARRIRTPEYQDKLVESLVAGIKQYHQATDRIAAARR